MCDDAYGLWETTNHTRELDEAHTDQIAGAVERHAFLVSSDPSMFWLFTRFNKTNRSKCKVVIRCLIQTQFASLS